jgi:hypothetical protein
MNGFAGSPPRRKAVTLIEAVLFISIAMAVIVGGLVFYQQASLATKVMNATRHVQAAIVETRAIQRQTGAWSYPNPGGDITDLLKAYGALSPISSGFGDMETKFYIDDFEGFTGHLPATLPVDICGARVVAVLIEGIPASACARMGVTDDSYQGSLSSGMIALEARGRLPPNWTPMSVGEIAPITPQDAARVCTFNGRISSSAKTNFWAYFIIAPPDQTPAFVRSTGSRPNAPPSPPTTRASWPI